MRAMSDRFRACHDAWQTRHPGQSPLDHISPAGDGWPRLKFTIGQKGSVIEAAAKCAPDEVRTCVEAALRSMTFPAPSGGVVTVIYP